VLFVPFVVKGFCGELFRGIRVQKEIFSSTMRHPKMHLGNDGLMARKENWIKTV
jgi:hypothetical protein